MEQFGPFQIDKEHIIYKGELVYSFVNLRPASEGHVLVSPRRVVQYLEDLTEEEKEELYATAHLIGCTLRDRLHKPAFQLTLQDGEAAGQTVPHLHIHVIPISPNNQFQSSPNLSFEQRKETATLYRSYFENARKSM